MAVIGRSTRTSYDYLLYIDSGVLDGADKVITYTSSYSFTNSVRLQRLSKPVVQKVGRPVRPRNQSLYKNAGHEFRRPSISKYL